MTPIQYKSTVKSLENLNLGSFTYLFGYMDPSLLGYAYLSCFSADYMFLEDAIEAFKKAKDVKGLHCCQVIAQNYNLPAFYYSAITAINPEHSLGEYDNWYETEGKKSFQVVEPTEFLAETFPDYVEGCEKEGFDLIVKLQSRNVTIDRQAEVLLVRDTRDGRFKILKELVSYRRGPVQNILNEDEVIAQLPELPFIPKIYGKNNICGMTFLRKSYIYGHSLSSIWGDKERVPDLLYRLSSKLKTLLYDYRLLFLDFRPENIIIGKDGESFVDLGGSQFLRPGEKEIPVLIGHPRYTAPETGLYMKASEKSLVFQLGIIAHELLTDTHPADVFPGEQGFGASQDELRYLFPLLAFPERKMGQDLGFISKMLESDPINRPDLQDCLNEFQKNHKALFIKRWNIPVPLEENNCVLFPARMGIPHSGHIDYMSRILDLGFKLIVSIQRSYSITDRDPLPKWLVMKMVAQSLMAYGYPKESFKIYLTPLYQTPEEVSMHFAMLPEMENVVAVASNNEVVLELFPKIPKILQANVLGREGETFIPRSWGTILRGSVIDGEYDVFQKYAAIGVEKILSFDEIKRLYMECPVTVPCKAVRAVLLNESGREITSVRVGKYSNPEESLAKLFNDSDLGCEMLDLYSKNSRMKLNGSEYDLCYIKTEFDGTTINIFFKLLKP